MPRRPSRHPTELELEILKILWRQGSLPVRDVRVALAAGAGRDLAHTSVVTMLNIMVRKGYLRRTKQGNAYVFHPRVTEKDVTQGMLRDMVDRVFDGSAAGVMVGLLESVEIDDAELARLRKLIDRKARE